MQGLAAPALLLKRPAEAVPEDEEGGVVLAEAVVVASVVDAVQARLWMRGLATLYVHLEEGQRFSHSEERRAWGHPNMMSGHAQRQKLYYDRFEAENSEGRMRIEMGARKMNSHFRCRDGDVPVVRRDGFMTKPLL